MIPTALRMLLVGPLCCEPIASLFKPLHYWGVPTTGAWWGQFDLTTCECSCIPAGVHEHRSKIDYLHYGKDHLHWLEMNQFVKRINDPALPKNGVAAECRIELERFPTW